MDSENSKKETVVAKIVPDVQVLPSGDSPRTNPGTNKRFQVLFLAAVVAVILAIALPLALIDDDGEIDEFVPDIANYETGVSLVTYWGINATVRSRLAQTVLDIEVANALDCVSIHSVTLQMPLAARITSLQTMADDGCTTIGKVKSLDEARETFVETASQGLPGAYVEERDSFTYSLQVALPRLGTTKVRLVLEEILRQRVNKIEFQIPFEPIEKVDHIELSLTILDNSKIQEQISLDLGSDFHVGDNITSTFHLDIPDAREHSLPRILRGQYTPGKIQSEGMLYKDGDCFEHFFLPSDLEVMPKNILFLFDVSNSYKFTETKVALKSLIDILSPLDTLTIQAFASRGTEEFWGAAKATDEEKVQAKAFVDKLQPLCCGSNLFEAYGEGLLRFRKFDDTAHDVNILMLLSNSWPSSGQTDRSKIADAVWKQNRQGQVKLFSLGFPDADIELLRAIAIMNGGVAAPLLEGFATFASQITLFFESEFGSVLTSDVNITFASDVQVRGTTQSLFPVLADGTELVVRGLLSGPPQSLQAITKAVTSNGTSVWTTEAIEDPFVVEPGLENSRCFQSYAHSRITQLIHLRDAARLLGDDVVEPVVTLTTPCPEEKSVADCIEQEALELAIKANVVVRGLTGLVTVDEEQCQKLDEEAEICIDGLSENGFPQVSTSDDRDYGSGAVTGEWPTASSRACVSVIASFILSILLTIRMAD